MVSGADVRQALQAGLWKALVDASPYDDGRAAMRATCRDARDMADELHDGAVLPLGMDSCFMHSDTWDSAAAIAAYHCKLGAMQSLHVWYSGGADDGARAAQFMEAYSAALGTALPAASCTITMNDDRRLDTSFAAALAVLLQRVVPRVERLDMTWAFHDTTELAQLLTVMGSCTHLCSLRLLPALCDDTYLYHDYVRRSGLTGVGLADHSPGSVLEALCGLTRLHTLSGPWRMGCSALERLCAALPGLTTLGFDYLNLRGAAGDCISRQLHTLAGWRHIACGDAYSQPWRLLENSAGFIHSMCNLQSSLPVVQQLEWVVLEVFTDDAAEQLAAAPAAVQRFAACAERWACKVDFSQSHKWLEAAHLAPGSLAAMQRTIVDLDCLEPTEAAACLRYWVAAAPNINRLDVQYSLSAHPPEALVDMLKPLCRAAHLHTLGLAQVTGLTMLVADDTALSLAEVVRGLVRPGAEGERCSALKSMLLPYADSGRLDACRQALADGGIDVSLDLYPWNFQWTM